MLDQLREKTTFILCRTQIQTDAADALASREVRHRNVREIHERPQSLVGNEAPEPEKNIPFKYSQQAVDPQNPATWGKVSRNDPCPCGSGKKFKHCHGKVA